MHIPFKKSNCFLAIAMLFGSASAQAEGGDLDDAVLFGQIPSVYSASKYEQKITEAPATVDIVTRSEIQKYGYRTLGEILASLPGFFRISDRNYDYVGVRGFGRPGDYNDRMLLLLNGHRVNENVYGASSVGNDFILDVDLIDRVEVIRGPSSSLYGSNAFFATVNVITRTGRDLKGGEVSASNGSYRTNTGRATYGNRFSNGAELLLSATGLNSQGQKNIFFPEYNQPSQNYGVAQNADHERSHKFFANFNYQDFSLDAAFSSRFKGIPTGAFSTVFNNPRSNTTDTEALIGLTYNHQLRPDLAFLGRFSYMDYKYNGHYVLNYGTSDLPDIVINNDWSHGERLSGELQFTQNISERQKATYGAEFLDNLHQDQGNYDIQTYLDDHRTSRVWAAYIQDEYNLRDNLILNAGFRSDHYSQFGSSNNPRVGLIYNPWQQTTFKLLYGQAFRAPNAYELYYQSPPNEVAAPNLKAETIKSTEFVVEQSLENNLRSRASLYRNRVTNLINLDLNSDGLLQFQNLGNVIAKGAEFELEKKFLSGWEGRASYTYQQTIDQQTGEQLTNSPKHLAKFNLTAPLVADRLFAGTEIQLMSQRLNPNGGTANGHGVVNFTLLGRSLAPGLDISASIYNVFDAQYGDPAAGSQCSAEGICLLTVPQVGRNYRLKMTYAF